jgi:hypothetical protein
MYSCIGTIRDYKFIAWVDVFLLQDVDNIHAHFLFGQTSSVTTVFSTSSPNRIGVGHTRNRIGRRIDRKSELLHNAIFIERQKICLIIIEFLCCFVH